MSRFFFIDKSKYNDAHVGAPMDSHLLELLFCNNCPVPKQYNCGYCYPGWISGAQKCFTCGKSFDGNTSATRIIIELDGTNLDSKGNKI